MGLSFLSHDDPQKAAKHLRRRLIDKLMSQKHVAWLVPGGSNIELSVAVMKSIPESLRSQLTVLQTDERYGAYDHPDSNWLQLRQAGFDVSGARIETMLTKDNLSLPETVARYNKILEKVFASDVVVVGQFGIGPDGHIAGMLPGSPAVNSQALVCGYKANKFQRVTMTAKAIKKIDVAYAFVFGESKKIALNNLSTKDLPLNQQPSQVLKQIDIAYIYSDQIKKVRSKR